MKRILNSLRLLKVLRLWLPLAIAIICLAGLNYRTVQQSLRSAANDPQIQEAEDVSASLASQTTPQDFNSNGSKIEIDKSLSPFLMIYDDSGKNIITTAQLNGQTPDLPKDIFDKLKSTKAETRFTWEPKTGVRVATVILPYSSTNSNGYVLVGRSLREIESREVSQLKTTAAATLITLASTLIATAIMVKLTENIELHKKLKVTDQDKQDLNIKAK